MFIWQKEKNGSSFVNCCLKNLQLVVVVAEGFGASSGDYA
jgi:hypothetical protein